jgi:hypothetical protein
MSFIVPTLIIFLLVLSFFLYPRTFLFNGMGDGIHLVLCQDPPTDPAVIKIAPNYSSTSGYQNRGDNSVYEEGVNMGEDRQYKLIKKNVPIKSSNPKEDVHLYMGGVKTEADGSKYYWAFPSAIGGLYSLELPEIESNINLIFQDYGLLFYHSYDKKTDKPLTVKIKDEELPVYDVYKDINKPDVPVKDPFKCREITGPKEENKFGLGSAAIPPQNYSPDNQQLQLEWFVLLPGKPKIKYWVAACKPAIYLYPPEKMAINVKVFPNGYLTYTDPLYDSKKGWLVEASPNGLLSTAYSTQPATYPYLYYESKIHDQVIKKPTKGWVVKYEELDNLYQNILPKLGLNQQQTQDFAEYWKKALHPSPYYFVGVIDQANVDQIERLEIIPKPAYINRVRIYFERLDSPKPVEAPVFTSPTTLNPSQFNVVEWGGMVKNDPNHPFTCSQ